MNWTHLLNRYAMVFFGCLVICIGFNIFLIPATLLAGGMSGISLIIYYLTEIPVGAQFFALNLPILFLAYRFFGRQYTLDTIIGTALFSVLIDLTRPFLPMHLVADPLLNAIFGGVLAGIGFGMVFKVNANTGGFDVLGAVVKKYYSVDIGTAIFAFNLVILLASAFIFQVETALYSLIAVYVMAELTNRIAVGFNREKSVLVISPYTMEMGEAILSEVHRGVTFFEGRGGLARDRKDVLFAVVSLTQLSKVKAIVYRLDPQAFMIVSHTSEVSGKGFTLECEAYDEAVKKRQQKS